jgi:putative sigma-54 modulation protein
VDNALAKIERQVVKNRSKLRTIIRHNNINAKKYEFLAAKEAAKIVEMAEVRKNKAFPVVALSDQDAEVALSTLDHDFYIYADPKTNGVKVMYRRDDGHVGVIDVMNAAIKPFKK